MSLARFLKSLAAIALPVLAVAQPQWSQYGGNAQHTGIAPGPIQRMNHILWQVPIDTNPPYSGTDLLIHYGSPLVSRGGAVLATVRIEGAQNSAPYTYEIQALDPGTGKPLWTQKTDWIEPQHDWIPSCGSCIGPDDRLYTPGAGGTVYVRSSADSAAAAVRQIAFYGIAGYKANPSGYNANVQICTPLTVDQAGNVFFGFYVAAPPFEGLTSGIARISSAGVGTWVSCDAADGRTGTKMPWNEAPAVSNDGKSVYIAERDAADYSNAEMLQLDSATLATKSSVNLVPPPENGTSATVAYMLSDGTSSPTVGPDGDIYYGVWWNNLASRGFMLHYSGDLKTKKPAGAFGWDDTASIVPAAAVPGYHGTSAYLILTKYNNYADPGSDGDGLNKVAILDPNAAEKYTVQYGPTHNPPNSTGPSYTCMKEVMTVLGPTPNTGLAGVREWCINIAAIDVAGKAAIVNSEDGHCYRWDLTTGALEDDNLLAPPTGEAYTPTISSKDGLAFAVNNATLACLWDGAVGSAISLPATSLAAGNSLNATLTLQDEATGRPTVATGPGATFKLTSSNAYIKAPSIVTVPPGRSSITFAVHTVSAPSDQTGTITATRYAFSVASPTLAVHSSAIKAISLSASTLFGNQSGTGTITLLGPAPTAGRTITMSSDLAAVGFQNAHLSVPAGQSSVDFGYGARPVSATMAGHVIARMDDGTSLSVPITVHAALLDHVALSPGVVAGGTIAQLTVAMKNAVPQAGVSISLAYGPHTSGPSEVLIGPGGSAVVSVKAAAVAATVADTVKASFEGVGASAKLVIAPPGTFPRSLSLSPSSVIGGSLIHANLTLFGRAPSGGTTVHLSTNAPGAVHLPASLFIPTGGSYTLVSFATAPVAANVNATVVATADGISQSGAVQVLAASLVGIGAPASVTGGTAFTGTVTLNGESPAAGAYATVASSVPAAAHAANGRANIPGSAKTGQWQGISSPVSADTVVTFTAAYHAVVRQTTVAVLAARLSAMTFNPASVTGGQASTGTITLNGKAGPGGAKINLVSNSANASVPNAVTVPAGAASVSFMIRTGAVSTSQTASIFAQQFVTASQFVSLTRTLAIKP